MLYFNLVGKYLVSVTEDDHDPHAKDYFSRHDFKSMSDAETMAARANELQNGDTYVAVDAGPQTWPRYDVVRLPKVGDKVSYQLGSDVYRDGIIVKVGNGVRASIVTDTGNVYYRSGKTAHWLMTNTRWCLVAGWYEYRNQEI